MQSGKLRHRLSLQEQKQTQDSTTGQLVVTWQEVGKLWASVEPLSAREFIAAKTHQSQVSARIVIRAMDGINASQRLVDTRTGAIYNIEGVLRDPKSGHHWMTIPVSEGVNDGQ